MYTFHSLSALFAPEGPNGTPEQNEQPTQNQDFDFVQAPIFKKGYGNRTGQTILPKHTPSETTQTLDKIQALEKQNKIAPQDAKVLQANILNSWRNLFNKKGAMTIQSESQLRDIAQILGVDQARTESLVAEFRAVEEKNKKSIGTIKGRLSLDASGNPEIKSGSLLTFSNIEPEAPITYTLTPEQIQKNLNTHLAQQQSQKLQEEGLGDTAEKVVAAQEELTGEKKNITKATKEKIAQEERKNRQLASENPKDLPLVQGQYFTKPLYENREKVQELLAQLPQEIQYKIMPNGRLDVKVLQDMLQDTQVAKKYEASYKEKGRKNIIWADGKFGMQTLAALQEGAPLIAAQYKASPIDTLAKIASSLSAKAAAIGSAVTTIGSTMSKMGGGVENSPKVAQKKPSKKKPSEGDVFSESINI